MCDSDRMICSSGESHKRIFWFTDNWAAQKLLLDLVAAPICCTHKQSKADEFSRSLRSLTGPPKMLPAKKQTWGRKVVRYNRARKGHGLQSALQQTMEVTCLEVKPAVCFPSLLEASNSYTGSEGREQFNLKIIFSSVLHCC